MQTIQIILESIQRNGFKIEVSAKAMIRNMFKGTVKPKYALKEVGFGRVSNSKSHSVFRFYLVNLMRSLQMV